MFTAEVSSGDGIFASVDELDPFELRFGVGSQLVGLVEEVEPYRASVVERSEVLGSVTEG